MKNATSPRPAGEQVVGTPWEFINAVRGRFGRLHVDLAALPDNAKADLFLTPEDDSLTCVWPAVPYGDWAWLNPPFGQIRAFLEQVVKRQPYHVLVLVPAAVGANWYADLVQGKAEVHFLNPRLKFEGSKDPYPKDLMLLRYGGLPNGPRTPPTQWRWKTSETAPVVGYDIHGHLL